MMTSSTDRVSSHIVGGVLIVTIRGEFTKDSPNCERFKTKIDELLMETGHGMVFDLGEITELDEFGLAELVAGWVRAREQDGSIAAANPSRAVAEFFSGTICDFRAYDSVESAVAAFSRDAGL